MKTTFRNLLCFCLLLAGFVPAQALTIVRTNDPSMAANLSPADVLSASAAFDYAAARISAQFNDPVTINITLVASTNPAILGESNSGLIGTFTYAQIRAALVAKQAASPTPDGATATAALPAVDPYGGTSFSVARGLAKGLGLIASDAALDGTLTFGTTFAYSYDPLNRAQAGKVDFIGVAYHEISEIMGSVSRLYSTGNGNRPFDVFRFIPPTPPGALSTLFTDANVYFSVNGGATNLKGFNANGNGGDLGDWASGANDSFNAFSTTGVLNDLTPVDIRVMDVLGWNLVAGTPPVVTTNPVSQTVTVGGNASFTAAASGTPTPAVQWEVSTDGGANFNPIGGATSSPLTFAVSFAQNGNKYRAVFSNGIGSPATTTAATLTVNRPPVPGVVSVQRFPTQSVKVPVSQITGAATDPDPGDTISLFSVANGANGTAQIIGGIVLYQPTGNFPATHTFSYTIQDNRGGQATGSVTVTVTVDNAPSQNIMKVTLQGNGSVAIDFAGIPGFTYGLQYKMQLADPVWINLGPVTTNQFGAGHAVDGPPPTGTTSGFYRLVFP